ncbi:O-antigen ligase family protein [Qipengyuania sphaerica]|uniref:O-antigen ligase family protein n=1 Tax=Qipengyuania sphaerica TaxID=2867243 RepID=UPI001C8839CF|nr:hypothetical protein [Qipengyuania sphaerica]MBX7540819.1 hypothetical protein [Qipengyuania sphaerica]
MPGSARRLKFAYLWFAGFFATYLLVSFSGLLPLELRGAANASGEVFAILTIPFAILGFARANMVARFAALAFFVFILCEAASTLFYPLKGFPQIQAALLGTFLDSKLIILAFGVAYFAATDEWSTKILFKRFMQMLILMAWLNLVFIMRDVIDGSENIYGEKLLVRAGIALPTGLYIHKAIPAQMGAFAAFACLVIARHEANPDKRKFYLASLIVAGLQILLSFSVKEIIAFIVTLTFYFSASGAKIDYRKAFAVTIGFSILSGAVLVTDNAVSRVVNQRFERYVGDESETRIRILLVNTSLDIAADRFPFGTGAGTFGSAPSRELGYSPIYVQYRFYRYVGGRPNGELNFLLDGFWPKVLAEGGWSGFLAYAFYLAFLFRAILRGRQEAPQSGTLRFVELCWLFTLPITIASGILTHERFVMVLAFTGFALGQRNLFAPRIHNTSRN